MPIRRRVSLFLDGYIHLGERALRRTDLLFRIGSARNVPPRTDPSSPYSTVVMAGRPGKNRHASNELPLRFPFHIVSLSVRYFSGQLNQDLYWAG